MELNIEKLQGWAKRVHQNACAHGWHEEKKSDAHWLCMVITEVAEAVEADRKGQRANTQAMRETLRIQKKGDIGLTERWYQDWFPVYYNEYIKGSIDEEFSIGRPQRKACWRRAGRRRVIVLLTYLGDGSCQFISVDGLEQVIDSRQFDGTEEIFPVCVGRGEDDMRQWNGLLHLVEQLHGITSLQLDVEEQQVGLMPEDAPQGTVVIIATVHHFHLLAEVLEFLEQGEARQALIFHDDGFQCLHDFSI